MLGTTNPPSSQSNQNHATDTANSFSTFAGGQPAKGGLYEQAKSILKKEHGLSPGDRNSKLGEIIESLHVKLVDQVLKSTLKLHKTEKDELNSKIGVLSEAKRDLEARLESESKKLRDLCIDAEDIRD